MFRVREAYRRRSELSLTVRISKPRGTYKTPKRVFNLKIVHHGNTVLRKVQDDGEMHEITIQ